MWKEIGRGGELISTLHIAGMFAKSRFFRRLTGKEKQLSLRLKVIPSGPLKDLLANFSIFLNPSSTKGNPSVCLHTFTLISLLLMP